MRLRPHPAALVELDEAVRYLAQQGPDLGAAFFAEVTRRIAQAARFPRSGSPISGLDDRYDLRQYLTRRFHYAVVTPVVADERLVLAIAHTWQAPGFWRERLK